MDEPGQDLLARLSALDPGAALDLVCREAVAVLDVSAAAVVLMSEAETGSIVASHGARAVTVEDLQFSLGEGPCLAAFATGVAVLDDDVASGAHRWPAFSRAAAAAGVAAVFAMPLRIGAIRLGTLYLVRDRPGPLTPERLSTAYYLASVATVAVLDQQHGSAGGVVPEDGRAGRAAVHQATGMVAVQLGSSLATALARLRAHAFAHNESIYDVAVDVITRRLHFSEND